MVEKEREEEEEEGICVVGGCCLRRRMLGDAGAGTAGRVHCVSRLPSEGRRAARVDAILRGVGEWLGCSGRTTTMLEQMGGCCRPYAWQRLLSPGNFGWPELL